MAWCLHCSALLAALVCFGAKSSFSQAANSIRSFNFPIFVITGNDVPVHNLTDYCFINSAEEVVYLEDLQDKCANQSHYDDSVGATVLSKVKSLILWVLAVDVNQSFNPFYLV